MNTTNTVIIVSAVVVILVLFVVLVRRVRKGARVAAYAKVAAERHGEVHRPTSWSDLPGFVCPHGKRSVTWRERPVTTDDASFAVTELWFRWAKNDTTSVAARIHTKTWYDQDADEFVGAAFEFGDEWLDDRLVFKSTTPTRLQTFVTAGARTVLRQLVEDCDGGDLCVHVAHDRVVISKVGLKNDYEGVSAHVDRCTRLFDAFAAASALEVEKSA